MDAYRGYSTHSSDYDTDGEVNSFDPGERIGAPLRKRKSLLLRATIILALVSGCGFAVEKTVWPGWTQAAAELGTTAGGIVLERIKAAVAAGKALPEKPRDEALAKAEQPADAVSDAGAAAKSTEASAVVASDGSPVGAAAEPQPAAPPVETKEVATAAEPPRAAGYEQPVTAQPTPPSDPMRTRAEAAGLHPDLSAAVLAKLSKADFKNAEAAIKTALAETPDGQTYSWPRSRKPELALFEVHFVPGAAPTCRRYVVTIAKDGWLTTALPMERCGLARGAKPS